MWKGSKKKSSKTWIRQERNCCANLSATMRVEYPTGQIARQCAAGPCSLSDVSPSSTIGRAGRERLHSSKWESPRGRTKVTVPRMNMALRGHDFRFSSTPAGYVCCVVRRRRHDTVAWGGLVHACHPLG